MLTIGKTASLCAALLLAAPLGARAADDDPQAGEYPAAAAAGRDEATTKRVRRTLSQDEVLRRANLGLMVNAGEVTLSGEVPDPATKARATALVERLEGVRSVVNEMTVRKDGRKR